MNKVEVRHKDMIDWFVENSVPVNKTIIFLSEPFETKNGLIDESGVFLPRLLEGYIWNGNIDSIIKRYVHELSHGSSFENFDFGKKIVKLDREVHKIELELFQDVKPPFYVITDKIRLKKKELGKNPIVKVDKEKFKKYKNSREELMESYNKYWDYIEGFALVVNEKIFDSLDRDLLPEYKNAYKFVKRMEKSMGFDGLTDYLKNL